MEIFWLQMGWKMDLRNQDVQFFFWKICRKTCLILKLRVQWLWRWHFFFKIWLGSTTKSQWFWTLQGNTPKVLSNPLSQTKLLRSLRGLINIPSRNGQLDSLKLTERHRPSFTSFGLQDVNLWGCLSSMVFLHHVKLRLHLSVAVEDVGLGIKKRNLQVWGRRAMFTYCLPVRFIAIFACIAIYPRKSKSDLYRTSLLNATL